MKVVDTSNLSNFQDQKLKEYFINIVIPEGIRQLTGFLNVTSQNVLPAFGNRLGWCEDDEGISSIPSKYKNDTTEGDFVLFVGVLSLSLIHI